LLPENPFRTPAELKWNDCQPKSKGHTRRTAAGLKVEESSGFGAKVTENKSSHFCKVCVATGRVRIETKSLSLEVSARFFAIFELR